MDPNIQLFLSLTSAFAGAFFAFIFLRLAEMGKALYDRKVKHHTALVKIEHLMNAHIDALHLNIYEIDKMIESHLDSIQTESIPFLFNRPLPLPFDESVINDLANLDLINTIFSYHLFLKRVNMDIERFNSTYYELRSAFQQKVIPVLGYMHNLDFLLLNMQEVKKAHLKLMNETKNIAASARIRLRRDRLFLSRLLPIVVRKHHERDFSLALQKELKVLEEEIAASGQLPPRGGGASPRPHTEEGKNA